MRFLSLLLLFGATSWALTQQTEPQMHPRTQERFDKVMGAYADSSDRDQVIADLEKMASLDWVKRKDYDYVLIRSRLAAFYWEAEQYEKSLEHARFCLEAEATPDSILRVMRPLTAQLLITLESYEDAVVVLKSWIALDRPKDAQPYFLAGYCHFRLKEWRDAATMVRLSLDRATTFNLAWHELLAFCLVEAGERDEAIQVLKNVLEKRPAEVRLWNNLGNQYTLKEAYRDALATMELSATYQPLETRDWLHIIRLYAYLGNPDRAARLLQDKIAEDTVPEDEDHVSLLADCHLLARNRDEAIGALTRLTEISPSGRGHERLGELLFQDAAYEEAADAYRTALDRGGLKDRARAQLYLGISMWQVYRAENPRDSEGKGLDEVLAELEKARQDKETAERVGYWYDRIAKYTGRPVTKAS